MSEVDFRSRCLEFNDISKTLRDFTSYTDFMIVRKGSSPYIRSLEEVLELFHLVIPFLTIINQVPCQILGIQT